MGRVKAIIPESSLADYEKSGVRQTRRHTQGNLAMIANQQRNYKNEKDCQNHYEKRYTFFYSTNIDIKFLERSKC